LGLPYGWGAKDKFINEDCSGLIISCLYAARPPLRNLIKEINADNIAKAAPAGNGNKLFTPVGSGQTKGDLSALQIQAGDLIGHVRFDSPEDRVTHVVIVEGQPTKANNIYTDIPIIESQGYDDKSPGRKEFTSSCERTVRHNYIAEYMNTEAREGVPYVKKFYVVRPK
jgi:hypothetical protein